MAKRSLFEEEHDIFRNSVRTFIAKEISPYHHIWEKEGCVPKSLWYSAGSAGLLCPDAPIEYGGSEDFRYNVIVVEELARAGATGPGFSVHSDIAAPYIYNYATKEQKNKLLPGMISGNIISAIAMTEPGTGSDLQSIKTTAKLEDDKIILSGSKTFITNGQCSDFIIVVAKTDKEKGAKGTSLVICETDRPGFKRGKNLDKIGLKAQDTSELFFDNVILPSENILGHKGNGFFHLMDQLPQERLAIAIQAVASAEEALNWTISYVKERHAFGKPLLDFQNTRFVLANIKTELTIARVYINNCIEKHLDKEFTAIDGAMVKLWATELQCKVIDSCLQLHGGYGYMWEYPIARAFADARVQRIYGGSNEIMKELIGRSL